MHPDTTVVANWARPLLCHPQQLRAQLTTPPEGLQLRMQLQAVKGQLPRAWQQEATWTWKSQAEKLQTCHLLIWQQASGVKKKHLQQSQSQAYLEQQVRARHSMK